MRVAVVLCIVLLVTASYGPVLAEEPAPDLDALILAGLENRTVTDEIERVLEDEDALLAFTIDEADACCLVDEQMAGVSHSTYERIRQTYATPARLTNLQEQHVKRDSKVDLTFKGMPFESEAWLVRLIVTIVVIVVIAAVTWYCLPAPAIPEDMGSLISDAVISDAASDVASNAASDAAVIAIGTRPVKPCEDFLEAMDILQTLARENADWACIEFLKGDVNAWAPYASPLPAP